MKSKPWKVKDAFRIDSKGIGPEFAMLQWRRGRSAVSWHSFIGCHRHGGAPSTELDCRELSEIVNPVPFMIVAKKIS